ncbi:hypothetical protein NQ317_014668 [Molorchus minor]|uniref:Uncharacterized protein n=1 Tax=Molorchus minor TaxID=1323400 RepID=A0ABQ9IXG9_9CUCU|nr:hypothetical protein NQ317_014668 [Molorchus minor]
MKFLINTLYIKIYYSKYKGIGIMPELRGGGAKGAGAPGPGVRWGPPGPPFAKRALDVGAYAGKGPTGACFKISSKTMIPSKSADKCTCEAAAATSSAFSLSLPIKNNNAEGTPVLTLICIERERDVLEELEFDDVTQEFALSNCELWQVHPASPGNSITPFCHPNQLPHFLGLSSMKPGYVAYCQYHELKFHAWKSVTRQLQTLWRLYQHPLHFCSKMRRVRHVGATNDVGRFRVVKTKTR